MYSSHIFRNSSDVNKLSDLISNKDTNYLLDRSSLLCKRYYILWQRRYFSLEEREKLFDSKRSLRERSTRNFKLPKLRFHYDVKRMSVRSY